MTTLATLAKALEVTVEELIEEHTTTTRHKREPASKLEQQLEQISSLPRAKQQFVIQMLDTVLQQASTNASEDFAESYAFYLLQPEALKPIAEKFSFMQRDVFLQLVRKKPGELHLKA